MKKLMVILMVLVMFAGCASQKMFRYADEKADQALVDKTIAEEKIKTLEANEVLIIDEYNKVIAFIQDTRVGILNANFPLPYLKYMNTLAKWNFPIEVAVLDTAKKESVK